jgi:D-methionine transport system permease protein
MHNRTFVETYLNFSQVNWSNLWDATYETLFMTLIAMMFTIVFGFLLGLLLFQLSKSKSKVGRLIFSIFSVISNVFRSIPFIVLLVLLIPFTRMLVGTMIGAVSVIPSLVISAVPFYARLVEVALREVDAGVLEAADAFGISPLQKVWKILIPESKPALISGITITTISMIGFTAMGGVVGGGGLGQLAYQQGWNLGRLTITLASTIVILILVFIIQFIGDSLVKITDKRG